MRAYVHVDEDPQAAAGRGEGSGERFDLFGIVDDDRQIGEPHVEGEQACERAPPVNRRGQQEPVDPTPGESFGFAELGATKAHDVPRGALGTGDRDRFVGLGVRPQLHSVAGGDVGHRPRIVLERFEVEDESRSVEPAHPAFRADEPLVPGEAFRVH